MAKDTVTLVLNGDEISLEEFAQAMSGLSSLLSALHTGVAKGSKVEWYVQALEAGSAIATAKCVEDGDTGAVERIVDAYETAGRAFRDHRSTDISPSCDRAIKRIVGLINGRIRSVRFETQSTDIEIHESGTIGAQSEETTGTIGTVQGRIETIGRHKGLRFTLYESHTQRAISCYLQPGKEEQMREAWGRLAIVEGQIRRDPTSGLPTTIRNVSDIVVLPDGSPRDCLEAFSVYRPKVSELPEVTIRRIRDA